MSTGPNPYNPPRAEVADRVQTRGPRPPAITIALVLIGLSLLARLYSLSAYAPAISNGSMAPISLAWPILGMLLVILLGGAIARGSNWARIVFAVFSALVLINLLERLVFRIEVAGSMIYQPDYAGLVAEILRSVFSLGAVYLIFFPARGWFARPFPRR